MITDDSFSPRIAEAHALKHDAKHEEALAILEDILAGDPANAVVLEEVADNELSLGRYDRAEKAAQQALTIDPKSCNAFYILGFIASHRGRFEESVTVLRQANALEPNDPEILRCLGWSLFSSGREVDGVVTLERALNLEPDNPLVLCDLGVVSLEQHVFPKAISLLSRAIDLEPENERARECLEMARRISAHAEAHRMDGISS